MAAGRLLMTPCSPSSTALWSVASSSTTQLYTWRPEAAQVAEEGAWQFDRRPCKAEAAERARVQRRILHLRPKGRPEELIPIPPDQSHPTGDGAPHVRHVVEHPDHDARPEAVMVY
eukprot:CAMPEP_0118958544 /NCGR_PEP_ID=MMETSP1169-20130426/62677_1 /TAXON_ID=36882 /ORGANISM="Pyramimonas obovata, Strain CCMP722" /LENGTH=115 /DNA_ID=CAMNT_0006906663 /DNA_START=37 /DNA_END=383 /DNA_ORIENTATION=-